MAQDDAQTYITPDHQQRYTTQPLDFGDRDDSGHDDDEARPRRRFGPLLRGLLGTTLALGIAAGGAVLYYDQTFGGRVYPNISIQGTTIGLSGREQARALLVERYRPFVLQPVALTFEGQTWQPSLDELGAHLEIDRAVDKAFAVGRSHDAAGNARELAAVWNHGVDLPVELTIDQARLQHYLSTVATQIDRVPVDAALQISDTTPELQLAAAGRQMLVDQTMVEVAAALQGFDKQEVTVRTRTLTPLLSDVEAGQARDAAKRYLQGPLVLNAEGKNWELPVRDLAAMLRPTVDAKDDGSRTIVLNLQTQGFDRLLDQIAAETGQAPKNPRLAWNDGNLSILSPGENGSAIDKEASRTLLAAAVSSPNRTVDLPFREVPPQINESNLATLGINELISVGQSDFSGSEGYRVTNVVNGMRILNGIVLSPGEEFSFNNNIGAIDARNGFVEGYAIVENRTQTEFGGGICQDSTTMFRAAFWAGVPITERWGHSFYISWYDPYAFGDYGNGPGMDATIFTGGPDLKFVNDTGNYLLIQSWANASSGLAEVRFYGTKPNRTVELIGPETRNRVGAPTRPEFVPDAKQPRGTIRQSDTARGGMDIYYGRVIVENGVRKPVEEFVTKFKPWPNIFVYNSADSIYRDESGNVRLGSPPPAPTEVPSATPETTPAGAPTAAPADGQQPPAEPAPAEPAPVQPAPSVEPAPPQEGQPVGVTVP